LSLITKKDREIEDLEEKRLLIESRSRSLEYENDSLRLALRLVAQDRSGDDSHQQEDCWRQDLSDDEVARGDTLGISGWGCAARTLEPLAYTRATFSWILLPFTRVNSPNHS